MVDAMDSSIPSESTTATGAAAVEPEAVEPLRQVARAIERAQATPSTWQVDKLTASWVHPITKVSVKQADLLAWEKLQRTPDGKDALRGVKLAKRLELYLAQQAAPVADATGTP